MHLGRPSWRAGLSIGGGTLRAEAHVEGGALSGRGPRPSSLRKRGCVGGGARLEGGAGPAHLGRARRALRAPAAPTAHGRGGSRARRPAEENERRAEPSPSAPPAPPRPAALTASGRSNLARRKVSGLGAAGSARLSAATASGRAAAPRTRRRHRAMRLPPGSRRQSQGAGPAANHGAPTTGRASACGQSQGGPGACGQSHGEPKPVANRGAGP